ncbi:hypothetical protein [Oceanobacillus oncorhynchi]|uniref:hypothetical protein n=1 Tax=Oceanobacillus oncorhynchi TaxID=545501 RepID=UPI0034D4C485
MSQYIADTADITMRKKAGGHVVFTAEAQIAGISASEESEIIRGGIGNKGLYTIKGAKEVTLEVTNATFSTDYLAMSQGAEITETSAIVSQSEKGLEVKDNEGTLEAPIKGTPIDDEIYIFNKDGESAKVSVSESKAEIPSEFAKAGDTVSATYKEEVTGKVLTIDAEKFSDNYEVSYKTIMYDTETNVVVKDIYFLFPNCSPSGEFEMTMENGTALTPSLTFEALADASTGKIGQVVEVERKNGEQQPPTP